MMVLKDLLIVRADIRIILMSATLNAQLFSGYFYDAPVIHIPGAVAINDNRDDILFTNVVFVISMFKRSKCPCRQIFYFLILFYISPYELLRKKNSIWIKCNLF